MFFVQKIILRYNFHALFSTNTDWSLTIKALHPSQFPVSPLFQFVYQSFLVIHFLSNIAHTTSVKQPIKPPKRDDPPCNFSKQMTDTRCLSEMPKPLIPPAVSDGSLCAQLNVPRWWQAEHAETLRFHFHLPCAGCWLRKCLY